MSTKKVLEVKDICELLGVCERTGYTLVQKALIREDMFKVFKIGRIYRIPKEPFLKWMDEGCSGIIL